MAAEIADASSDPITTPICSGPIVCVPPRPVVAVTRWGFIRVPPFAIVAATSAIWRGVTSVSAWPYEALASSVSSLNPPAAPPPPLVTCEAVVGRSKASGAPKPIRPANLTRLSPPVRMPARANQMFEDHSVAAARSNDWEGTPGCSWTRKPPTSRPSRSAFGCCENVVSAVILPDPRPAIAVTILNTEPGTYWPCVARVSSGRAVLSRTAANASREVFGLAIAPESYVGVEASARISPVAGSIITTAPRSSPSPCTAARWSAEEIPSVSCCGSYGWVWNLRRASPMGSRFEMPVTSAFHVFSSPAVPKSDEA